MLLEMKQMPENVSNLGNSAASTPASDSKLSWQEQKEQQARERKRKNELKKTEEEIAKLEDRNTEIDRGTDKRGSLFELY